MKRVISLGLAAVMSLGAASVFAYEEDAVFSGTYDSAGETVEITDIDADVFEVTDGVPFGIEEIAEDDNFASDGDFMYDEEVTDGYSLSGLPDEYGEYASVGDWDLSVEDNVTDVAEDVMGGYMISDIPGEEFAANIAWPTTSKIKTYVISTKNNTKVYKTADSKDGSYGTIYAGDLITILGYKGSRFHVSYPLDKGGTKEGYIDKSAVTSSAINVAKNKYTAKEKMTTYRRSNGAEELGYVSKGDTVYEIASSGGYTQILYDIGNNYYKMGWLKNTNGNNPSPSGEEGKISDRISKMMNGSYGGGIYKTGKKYTGPYSNEQCKGFAKQIHKELFGYLIGSTNPKPNNHTIAISKSNTKLVGSVTSMTESNLKKVFMQARPGDFVQIRRSHGGSHSAIIVSASSSGVTMYEANLDGKNTISKNSYTWSQLINKNAAMSLYTAKSYKLN